MGSTVLIFSFSIDSLEWTDRQTGKEAGNTEAEIYDIEIDRQAHRQTCALTDG